MPTGVGQGFSAPAAEKMLTAHLINTCGKLWRETQASAMGYAAIDNWTHEIEDAAEKTRSWRLAHG